MPARFYVPDLDPARGVAHLPADEAHHLVKVLRLETGAIVGVFDGRGCEWRARVVTADRNGVEVSLLEPVSMRAPVTDLTLVQAVLKGQAMDDVIRDCTMVGVTAIQPVLTARTTVKTSAMQAARDRWRRVALASAKQCGAARLPQIDDVVSFGDWIDGSPVQPAFILVEPSVGAAALTMRRVASQPVPARATLVVGPEGGWTEEERDRAVSCGCSPLSLGPLILRADAVPLAAAAALLAIWGE
jgi:16S rRNA (uracil1498-N3)-methyltransferase